MNGLIMILKIEKNACATYLVPQGDNKCDGTKKE